MFGVKLRSLQMAIIMSDKPLERQFEIYAGIHRLNAFFGIEIDMEAEISGAIRAIATSIELVQKAAQLAGKTRNVELIEAITDLRMELSQAKIAAANANERIADLLQENQKLEKRLVAIQVSEEKKLVIGVDGLYYTPEGEGPFCTGCYDNKGKTIRVTKQTGAFRRMGEYRCPVCGHMYGRLE